MCIQKIEAFTDSKGEMFKTERCAIQSEIAIITGMVPDDVMTLISKASPLVPLLQRVLAIAPPAKPKAEAVAAEPTTLLPHQDIHKPECRARATGLIVSCNCGARCEDDKHIWNTVGGLVDVCSVCGEERA